MLIFAEYAASACTPVILFAGNRCKQYRFALNSDAWVSYDLNQPSCHVLLFFSTVFIAAFTALCFLLPSSSIVFSLIALGLLTLGCIGTVFAARQYHSAQTINCSSPGFNAQLDLHPQTATPVDEQISSGIFAEVVAQPAASAVDDTEVAVVAQSSVFASVFASPTRPEPSAPPRPREQYSPQLAAADVPLATTKQ